MANEETSARNGGGNLVGMFYMSPFIGGNMYKILLSELSNGVCGIYKIDIRNKYKLGKKITEIHKFYPFVSRQTIERVCKRLTWKHIE